MRRTTWSAAAWLLCCAAGSAFAGDDPAPVPAKPAEAPAKAATAAGSLDEAVKLLSDGKFQEASDAAGTIAADDPAYVRARYLMGEVARMRGEAGAAEGLFRSALEKKPGAEPLLTGLGRALLALDRAMEAVGVLEKAVAANAKSAVARAALGLARSRAGKPDEGRKDLAAAAKLDPESGDVARMAVEERLAATDTAGAAKVAAAFAKARKDTPLAPFLVALVDDRAGRHDEAIAGYEKALAMDDAFLDAHKNLAILCIAQNPLYRDAKRTEKAVVHFQKYADLGGRDQEVLTIWETLKSFVEGQGGSK